MSSFASTFINAEAFDVSVDHSAHGVCVARAEGASHPASLRLPPAAPTPGQFSNFWTEGGCVDRRWSGANCGEAMCGGRYYTRTMCTCARTRGLRRATDRRSLLLSEGERERRC